MSGGPQAALLASLGRARSRSRYGLGFFNRQGCKMSARPKSQMHHRALSSTYSNAPLVTIFNLIKRSAVVQLHESMLDSCSKFLWFITPALILKASGHGHSEKHKSPAGLLQGNPVQPEMCWRPAPGPWLEQRGRRCSPLQISGSSIFNSILRRQNLWHLCNRNTDKSQKHAPRQVMSDNLSAT